MKVPNFYLDEETKQLIRDLAEQEKKEMQNAGEWDYDNILLSISRCYDRVLNNLLSVVGPNEEGIQQAQNFFSSMSADDSQD